MSNTSELDQLSTDAAHCWMLPTLVSAAIRASAARSQPQPEPLSAEIAQLVSKDTAVPAKVYNRGIYYHMFSTMFCR